MCDCNGDGFCLRQGDGPNGYELNDCPHKCVPEECPNFKVCGSINPKAILQCHKGTCMNCAAMFGKPPSYRGKLTFYDSVECPVCLDTKPGVKQPNCDHMICIDCFTRCRYGEIIQQPVFPYSRDIEDEYDNAQDDPKWLNDVLIKKYKDEWLLYETAVDDNYRKEQGLRVCGLCRK
jgi:hypothetical protein